MLNQEQLAFLAEILPCWKAMDREHQRLLERTMTERSVKRGEYLYQGDRDCTGVFWMRYGQARVFLISGTEKQITLYRLLERDSCFLSASCVIKNINFDVFIQAEKDCRILLLSANVYQDLMEKSFPLATYCNQILASRFSDVMWVMEQTIFTSLDRRLALFLLEQKAIDESSDLHITHEAISNHLGTAREVVTRMLKYFQEEGLVSLSRGAIEILDEKRLKELAYAA